MTTTATEIARPTGFPLRRIPARAYDAPYDDELAENEPAGSGAAGMLALAFPLASGVPAVPASRARLRLVPAPPHGLDPDGDPPPDLPSPGPWAARLIQAVAEVLDGDRPVAQLVRWSTLEVHAKLLRRAARAPQLGPAAAARRQRPVVRSVHVSQPTAGVAEACALIWRAGRGRALAVRLEWRAGRWICTAVDLC